jgi:hypothetical protein
MTSKRTPPSYLEGCILARREGIGERELPADTHVICADFSRERVNAARQLKRSQPSLNASSTSCFLLG